MIELRIKDLCKEKGMKMDDLAKAVGISQPSLSNIANGKQMPRLETIEKISDALGVEVAEIFAPRNSNTFKCPHCGKTLQVVVVE